MAAKVVFAFDQDAGGVTNFFQLDDSVKGVLDNTTYTLGGEFSLVDVTSALRSVSVSRGRSRQLDRVQAGNASIVLDNRDRAFDPLGGGTYASSIVPRKNVQVSVNDEPVFSGLVDDWNIDFDVTGDSTSTAACGDGFVTLGQVNLGTATRTAELSGTRIDTVLTEAGWPTGKRALDAGEVTLQADTPSDNTNVLAYLQTITDTEFGAFFMSRTGLATFIDRDGSQDFSNPVVLGGTGIPISSVEIDYGTEQLFNTIEVSRNNGGTALSEDSTSQTAYGIQELSKTGLLYDDDAELSNLGEYLLSRFKDPSFRIEKVSVLMDGLSDTQKATVARLDIADPLQVTFSPAAGSAVSQFANVDRIEHNITPGSHTVSLSMSQAQPSFVLDSSDFGILDTNTLGF